MGLDFPAVPPAPDLNSPDTFNQRVLDMFTWCAVTMPGYLEALSAEDFFSVQSSATDTTAGKLLKLSSGGGVFGLGVNDATLNLPPNDDLDALTVSGLFRYAGGTTTGAPSTAGVVLSIVRLQGKYMQLAVSHDGLMYLRAYDAVSWSAWVEVLTSDMVQSSATDATFGKLLKLSSSGTGTFGLGVTSGNAPTISDFTAPPASGLYRYLGGSGGAAGNPDDGAWWGSCIVGKGLSGDVMYIASRVQDANNPPKLWIGSCQEDGTGLYWTEVVTRNNLLGTVSQSAGVPTGAVIERGNNSNGRYVRFADGTQICTRRMNASASGAEAWTFPASFIEEPQCSVLPISAGAHSVTAEPPSSTTTYVEFNCFDTAGARQAKSCHLTATGRWF
ncbi:pyocin knob domain-containing protein [Leisingera methylohalidivorans]|uniref:Tail fiber protein n=1 Tax=Leisingera methylohalidivorans DSM 14336 TaxID=999552 RepID=V9VZZ9_9RHOB|nr:pyocin knob domain-containing protein [Leisingera methylohalidivorans]AHD02955.1 hypothetical protein METH_06910 [Leisingera methylohalidivorans DSM 14336]